MRAAAAHRYMQHPDPAQHFLVQVVQVEVVQEFRAALQLKTDLLILEEVQEVLIFLVREDH
jgi:hypothetical protein